MVALRGSSALGSAISFRSVRWRRSGEFSSEVNVDVRYVTAGKFEMLDVGETRPSGFGGPVSDQGTFGVGANVQQGEGLDALVRRPAPFEVRGPVDPVVVWTGEGEVLVEKLFDGGRSSFS